MAAEKPKKKRPPARSRRKSTVPTPAPVVEPAPAVQTAPTRAEIAARAYQLYLAGSRDTVGNWFAAERQLRGDATA